MSVVYVMKKARFARGLCLSWIVIATQCSTIEAKNTKAVTQADIINMCEKISWKVNCNNIIYNAADEAWIKKEYYKNSIRKVIGIAIADCITESNEFTKKNEAGIILFDADPTRYTPENWNAVILYNYLYEIKHDFINNSTREKNTIFNELFDKVYEHYSNTYRVANLWEKIEKAVSDIKEYDKALNIKAHVDESLKIIDHVLHIGKERNTRQINEEELNKISLFTTYSREVAPGVTTICEYPSKKDNRIMKGYWLKITTPILDTIDDKKIRTDEVYISYARDGYILLDLENKKSKYKVHIDSGFINSESY